MQIKQTSEHNKCKTLLFVVVLTHEIIEVSGILHILIQRFDAPASLVGYLTNYNAIV